MTPPPPVTPEFQRLISGSRLRLRGKSAFFATLLLHAEFVPSREVVAAGTDGERIYVNPDVAPTLPPYVLDGLLLHEVLHAALSHVQRRGPREKKRWNKAADTIVNGMVVAAGLPTPPQSVRDEHLERLSVEEVYSALQGQDDGEGNGEGDDLLDGPPSDAPPREGKPNQNVTRQWQQAMAQARSVDAMSGGKGDDPLGAHRELARLAPARLDWRAQLWRFLARTPVDFGGFDRRFVGRGLYLEALDDESLTALVAVDTSGSVNDEAVRALVAEVQGVLGAYPHVRAVLYYADTEAYGPFDLRPGDEVPAPVGGGGTDFRPIFKLTDTHEPDVLIYLTDGYGDFPEQAPSMPTLWVVPPGGLEDEGFPFGDVLRLEE
ncbi:vWA domain-containing protein [Deinococcus hopiensis]|uniref:Predicted metal-dependent peptidase n=1 Tax=Deinococcus hopiensis KR-140 TaxID=695939 RepID=A0A1W1VF11_9DEIO|nr:VWA-like domain-containing protein [Deinococcus hopiensis]SMB91886.1 Predicted metal-dependent peptidase [Deinococcus hopiensis KR-140]